LAPDDARRWPYPQSVIADEIEALTDRRRWLRKGVDVLAVRLQYGRGTDIVEVGLQFGFSRQSLWQRARQGRWSRAMSEANRIDMARRVWLAGLARFGRILQETPDAVVSPETLQALREASAWQPLPPKKPMWAPLDGSAHDEGGPSAPPNEHAQERQSLLDNPANPDRTYRDKVAANLERLIARLERQKREKAEGAAGETSVEGEKTQE
jgi:hypothetical protein